MVTRIGAGPAQYAQTSVPAGTTYTWHGELVSLDQTSRALTVKSMVAGSALEELTHFKAGDRIMLGWSGFDKYANAINHVVRYDPAKFEDHFAFPAEFVSFDAAQRYLTFKSQIPAESVAKLSSLKPGQWVTATSAHGKASETQPVVAVRPYNEPSSNS